MFLFTTTVCKTLRTQGQGTGTEEYGLGGDYWQGGESSTLALGGHPNTKASQIQSMYRWLLGDAIPFGESIQLSIEHGGTNMVDQEYEAVTMFYARSGAWLRLVDKVTIGDPLSESQHNYSNTDAGEVYHITSGWVGAPPANDSDTGSAPNPIQTAMVTVSAREIKGSSTMTLSLGGSGTCHQVLLRRTMDYQVSHLTNSR